MKDVAGRDGMEDGGAFFISTDSIEPTEARCSIETEVSAVAGSGADLGLSSIRESGVRLSCEVGGVDSALVVGGRQFEQASCEKSLLFSFSVSLRRAAS